jgi:hypothetical protein
MRLTVLASLLALACAAPPAAAQNLPPDVCTTLREVRGSGPITSDAQLGAMLNRVAWTHRLEGIGLNRKAGGNNCPSPAGVVACDILQRKSDGTAWDVLGSAGVGEPTTVNCGGAIGLITDPARPWVAPVDPGGTPTPAEPSTPAPTPPATDAVLEELRLQTSLLNAIHIQLDTQAQLTRETNAALDKFRVDVIKATKDLVPQILKILPLLGALGGK